MARRVDNITFIDRGRMILRIFYSVEQYARTSAYSIFEVLLIRRVLFAHFLMFHLMNKILLGAHCDGPY